MSGAKPKGAQPEKVEARSRTGGSLRRAGMVWTSEWQLVPEDLVADKDRSKALASDPSIEFRIDGRRIPRLAGDPGDPESKPEPSQGELADIRSAFRDLEERYDALQNQHNTQAEAHDAEVRQLKGQLADVQQTVDIQLKQIADLQKSAAAPKATEPAQGSTVKLGDEQQPVAGDAPKQADKKSAPAK